MGLRVYLVVELFNALCQLIIENIKKYKATPITSLPKL